MESNILWIAAGFVFGAVAVWMFFTLAIRKNQNPEETKLTAVWGLEELTRKGVPQIVAERVENMRFPKGSRVIVPRGAVGSLPASILADCDVRMHEEVRGNFAIGEGRALVFSSHVHPKAWVIWSRDAIIVQRLGSEFARMWRTSEPFVERVTLDQVGARMGSRIQVRGNVLEKYDYHGKTLLRLTDGQSNVGLLTEDPALAAIVGRDVVATGRVVKEAGHAVIAVEVVAEANAAPTTRRPVVTTPASG